MKYLKHKGILIIAVTLAAAILLSAPAILSRSEKKEIPSVFLPYKVLSFANRYKDQDVIVVSKKHHLLFYCKNGKIIRGEKWNGLTYNFPVKVSLAGKYYRTPEGEMFVDYKNPYSKYVLFLSLSYPGAYGIHSGPTQLRSYLEKMEKQDPDFEHVTRKDDTRGCVAVENRVIKYLYAHVDVNTPVLILPE